MTNEHLETGSLSALEKEMIAQAETVLGAVPKWFLENRKTVEKNRVEQHEWNQKISREIRMVTEELNRLAQ